ncbi:hypothetical protein ANO14919_106530 [Xylariales sp. No.14919]|nr:hypothetical protein ANO14919_106530 [Xylariales sp. No.14919]
MSGSRQFPSPPPAYELQDLDYDGIRVAAAVEEGRPDSSRRLRTAEQGGLELAWIKATFAVGVSILILAVVGLGLGVWRIITY